MLDLDRPPGSYEADRLAGDYYDFPLTMSNQCTCSDGK